MPRKTLTEATQCAVAPKAIPTKCQAGKTAPKGSQTPFRLKPPRPLEASEQAALFQYATLRARSDDRWGMLFAIPNGKAASSIREAINAKRTGLKRGVPDMFLPVPVGPWHGLFLELKRTGGSKADLKPEQAEWLQRLQAHGYQTVVAFGWKEAVAEIAGYLAGGAG